MAYTDVEFDMLIEFIKEELGFPDSFVVNPSDSFAYKQFGDSVSVSVVEAVIDDFIQHNRDALGW